jgi:DNA-binding Lrp family transcriptional regulator
MKSMIKAQTPARAIAKQLDRTEAAVRQRIHKLGLSLRSSKKRAKR